MYLKEIKAYGFKSFADKINIEFGKNINGIVGPNGSGKSNIVDAVRWVLGEQSMKSLRGDSSLDVIFSGSDSRKPLNSASVTLVFDNEDRILPIDFSEVSIKRMAFRTGENEYYINNEKVRLKDITELLTDSGTAKESFNIISQGKIDEILSNKPEDRRIIFEEAAGVFKYKRNYHLYISCMVCFMVGQSYLLLIITDHYIYHYSSDQTSVQNASGNAATYPYRTNQ
mgnify:CR=1 FL=1